MNSYERVLWRIAENVHIIDDVTFEHPHFGRLHPPRDMETRAEFPVVTYLAKLIYLAYHAGDHMAARMLVEGGKAVASIPDHEDYKFAEELHAANTGNGYLVDGWQVTGRLGEDWIVEKDRIRLRAGDQELVSTEPVQVGAEVAVRFPPYKRYAVLGWYMAIGDAGVPQRGDMVRIYFTLDGPTGAPDVMRMLTSALNRIQVPFQFKMANHPAAYLRRDTGVLYLGRSMWLKYRCVIHDVYAQVKSALRDDPPCFALPLDAGMSFATEPNIPGQRLSFGEHRCLLVAEGLVRAYQKGIRDVAGRYRSIVERFHEEGISTARPYAEPHTGAR